MISLKVSFFRFFNSLVDEIVWNVLLVILFLIEFFTEEEPYY